MTIGDNLKKLLEISTDAICEDRPQIASHITHQAEKTCKDLIDLLSLKNGFYALESALHVFAAGCGGKVINIDDWNESESWKKEYGELVQECLFFAEDIFGVQFAISQEGIVKFDPETGEVEVFAPSLEEWARRILKNYDYETGYQLAHDWQIKNGPLPVGKRLLPKTPFVLGGAYEIENLYAADAFQGMQFRADIWRQIRDLPDGSQVKIKITS